MLSAAVVRVCRRGSCLTKQSSFMKLKVTKEIDIPIRETRTGAMFIESKNTQGAGLRWLDRYEEFLTKELVNLKRLSLCKNAVFNKLYRLYIRNSPIPLD